MRYLYALLFLNLLQVNLFAQTDNFIIEPLLHNQWLLKEKSAFRTLTADTAIINLPFADDFSYDGPYPDPLLWLDKKVYINSRLTKNAPTFGVATFDGIDSNGRPYSSSNEYGSCDTLTSAYINMATYQTDVSSAFKKLSPTDRVTMSFFLEPKGLGYAPAPEDSIVLEFRDSSNNWNLIKSVQGLGKVIVDSVSRTISVDSVPPFTFYHFPIKDARYFFNKFQFRFRNYGRRGGAYEQWHLDYVKIAPNRDTTSKVLSDVAFVEKPPFILSRYTSMPWRQAYSKLETEIQDTFSSVIYNYFNDTKAPTDTRCSVKTSNNLSLVTGITIQDALNIPPGVFYATLPKKMPQSLRNNLSGLDPSTPSFSVITKYQLTIGAQETRDTQSIALRNDVVTNTTNFSNYYAYDDGTAELQFTATGTDQSTAIKFVNNEKDTLRGFMIAFPHINGDAGTNTFNFRIWKDSLGGTPIFQMFGVVPVYVDTVRDSIQAFTTYTLKGASKKDTSIIITPGNFYIGWQNVGNVRIPIGLDRNNLKKSQYLYQFLGDAWQKVTQNIGAVMLRPIVGGGDLRNSSALATENVAFSDFMSVYPNPARDVLNIDIKTGKLNDYELNLFDLTGRLLKKETLESPTLNVSDVQTGLYILMIRNKNDNRTAQQKLMIMR